MDVGGAAIAVIRLHEGLLELGQNSNLLVRSERRLGIPKKYIFPEKPEQLDFWEKIKIKLRLRSPHSFYDQQGLALEGQKLGYGFSYPQSLNDITQHELYHQADIIHLHWIGKLLDFDSFFQKNTKPVVWTLHDFNPFSGGLHYPIGTEYISEHLLDFIPNPKSKLDFLLNKNLEIKIKALEKVQNLTVVATSQYLKKFSEKSIVLGKFPHQLISLGLNISNFKPYDKFFCRNLFGLAPHKRTFVFSATNSMIYKGLPLLLEVLERIKPKMDFQLLAVGLLDRELLARFPEVRFTGMVHDEKLMAMVYSAADLFVNPSMQEAFGQTTIEALACGVPVVAFPTGGAIEVITPENGILCPDFSSQSLEKALWRFFETQKHFNSDRIRQKAVENFDIQVITPKYLDLYKKINL